MLRTGFIRKPQAIVVLNKEEVAQLMECSRLHYDGLCQSWSRNGGKIFGWVNEIVWKEQSEEENKDISVELTFRDVDILSKITENFLPGREKLVMALHRFFGNVCQELKEETQRINPEAYETEEAYLARMAEQDRERRG